MYPIGEDFKRTLKNSHKIAVKVEVLDNGVPVKELDIHQGNVSVDRHKNVRRSCSIQVVDPLGELTPKTATDLLTPYGNELKLYRGVRIRNNVRSYQGEVLRDNPKGYWRFEERGGYGPYKDSSIYGPRDATKVGTTQTFPDVRGAIIDQFADARGYTNALRMDQDYLQTTNPKQVVGKGAIEFWVKVDGWGDNTVKHGIFQNVTTWGNTANYISVFRWSTNSAADVSSFYFRTVNSGGAIQDLAGPWTNYFPKSGWCHVVCQYDYSVPTMELWVNGVRKGTKVPAGTLTAFPSSNVQIGRGHDAPLNGSHLDEFAIYDSMMSEAQIVRHFETGRAKRAEYREEYVPLGVFGIEEVTVADGGDNFNIQVEGVDRAMRVERARFVNNYVIPEGTNYATAIRNMIDSVVPGLTYNFMTTTRTTPKLVFGGSGGTGGGSAWENGQHMAKAIGAELYFDVNGVCVLAPIPDYSTAPVVWEYQEGPTSLLLYASKGLAREGVFNHVIAQGESSSNTEPVQAEAMDLDQSSPTYVLGKFGRVPMWFRSEKIKTTAQAQDVADGLLRLHSGLNAQVYFIGIVNPAHDAGDVIAIVRERAGITGKFVLEKFNIPLTYSGSMNATVKERRI